MVKISPKEYERVLNWDDAMMYCQLLIIDGKNDWRLPTKEELNDIGNSENDFVGSYYWSSTEHDGNYAWRQGLSYGGQYGNYPSLKNHSYYVRAVRSLTI
jgi:hypothetical protein